LLTGLVLSAKSDDKLSDLAVAVEKAISQLPDDANQQRRDQLACLHILIQLCSDEPAKAIGPLTDWLKRMEKKTH